DDAEPTPAQVWRGYPSRGGEQNAGDREDRRSARAKSLHTEQNEQDRKGRKRGAAGSHECDVGEKKDREYDHCKRSTALVPVPGVDRQMAECERTDQEFLALEDVVLDRDAWRPDARHRKWPDMQEPGNSKQGRAGHKEATDNPSASIGAPEHN